MLFRQVFDAAAERLLDEQTRLEVEQRTMPMLSRK